MPSPSATAANVRQMINEAIAEAKEAGGKSAEAIFRPKRLEKVADGATRAGQVMALFFLGPIILVCFTLIRVINNIMASVLGAGSITGGQLPIIAFLVSFLTLALLLICAWGWFQFVRTAGFGAFSFD